MPDTHPIESEPQTQAQAATGQSHPVSGQPHALSPSSTLSVSTSNTSSAASSTRQTHHRRFFSLGSLENSSTTILNTIRSRSPLPRSSTPVDSKERQKHAQKSSSPSSHTIEPNILRSSSPTEMSPTSSIVSPRPSSSHSRMPSNGIVGVSSTRSRSDRHKRYSGTLNHYGRHSNDWLFGGFSVRDTFRDGIEKLRGHNDRD
ncbi:hypothetical protein PISL3812_00812 [Talaromyces islandicus]|uniref:Uncharacterized protein n=1 Tax=Talaromyces islandicus TaxID=28573 RepID=A0A0U1LMV7_TALIS|nr:hypothetical protein PISL3812_00812 [Talaromyces islandicus]